MHPERKQKGEEVAELWEEAQQGEAKQMCCWDILLIARLGREVKTQVTPPVVRGKGVRGKEPYRPRCAVTPRILSDVKDTAERKTIARQMTIMAKTWKKSTLLADVKDEEQEEAMWRRTEDRIAQVEATSTRARLRTWISWTRWVKNRDIQPLEAAATLVQEFALHEARTGTGPSESGQERGVSTLSGAQST